jgi:ABC-type lipoprotein release transport system permease subunit
MRATKERCASTVSSRTGRLVESFLYQVRPLDILTYLAVAVVLSAIGLLAAVLPARKAVSIDPMQALRED